MLRTEAFVLTLLRRHFGPNPLHRYDPNGPAFERMDLIVSLHCEPSFRATVSKKFTRYRSSSGVDARN